MNSLLPGSPILRSAALFMSGFAVTLAGGLLLWPAATPHRVAGKERSSRDEFPARDRYPLSAMRRTEVLSQLAEGLAETNRARRGDTLQKVASTIAADDVRTALDIATHIVEGDDRIDFLRIVFVKWAEREPADALAHALAYSDAKLRTATLSSAMKTWAAAEPSAAFAWLYENVSRNAAPETRTTAAMSAALAAWATADLPGMQKWIAALAPGQTADEARMLLGEAEITAAPLEALHNAGAIVDPALRENVLIKFYRQWRAYDAVAADTWLEQSAPPQLRARVVQR
jgi:hypothetical protein